MVSLVVRARELASVAHAGQVDKAGVEYISHPRRVAERVARVVGEEDAAVVVAWLHDVVEDTGVSLEEISDQFGARVAAGVDAMTHRVGEPRAQYYARVKADPLALVVKRADIADNTAPERVALLDEATRERLAAKYAAAWVALGV